MYGYIQTDCDDYVVLELPVMIIVIYELHVMIMVIYELPVMLCIWLGYHI